MEKISWHESGIWCNKFYYPNDLENNNTIISKFERMDQEYSECFKPEWSDVDEALLKWYKEERNDNVPVNSPLPRITSVLSKF